MLGVARLGKEPTAEQKGSGAGENANLKGALESESRLGGPTIGGLLASLPWPGWMRGS